MHVVLIDGGLKFFIVTLVIETFKLLFSGAVEESGTGT